MFDGQCMGNQARLEASILFVHKPSLVVGYHSSGYKIVQETDGTASGTDSCEFDLSFRKRIRNQFFVKTADFFGSEST